MLRLGDWDYIKATASLASVPGRGDAMIIKAWKSGRGDGASLSPGPRRSRRRRLGKHAQLCGFRMMCGITGKSRGEDVPRRVEGQFPVSAIWAKYSHAVNWPECGYVA